MRQHVVYTRPCCPILYPHLKKAGAPPVESLQQRAQQKARQRWNLPITGIPHEPPPSTQTHRPHLPTAPKRLRNRTTMPHLPTTRAPVGSTRPTIRQATTAQPAQNPKTPTQKNRPRHRAARAATPPKKMSTRHGMAFLSLAVSWLRLCEVPSEMTLQPD